MKTTRCFLLAVAVALLTVLLSGSACAQEPRPDVGNYITEDGLARGVPTCVSVDPGGWAWVGSKAEDDGVGGGFSIIGETRRIMSFSTDDGLGGPNVFDVVFDVKNNCIWFATSGGLSRLDAKTGQWKNVDKLSDKAVKVLFPDEKGNLLIGTKGAGLLRMKAGADEVETLKCPFMVVNDVLIDSKNRIWVSSPKGAAYREKGVWVPYSENNSTLAANDVGRLAEAKDGRILGATEKGVVVFDGISWSLLDTSNSGLPVDQATDILATGDGEVWVATWGGGLVQLDDSGKMVKLYSRKNCDLLDNRITAMERGRHGNFWLCTARGVSRLVVNPQTTKKEKVRVFSLQKYIWEGEKKDNPPCVNLQTALARQRYGFVIWSWAAFKAKSGFDRIDPQTTLEIGLFGNQWLNISGCFPSVTFHQGFVTLGHVVRNFRENPGGTYPFPEKFPAEIAIYLKHAQYIPANDDAIRTKARSLVKKSSRGDMMRTAEDIIYSKFFSTMPFDYGKGEKEAEGVYYPDPRVMLHKTAEEVLKEKAGTGYAKNRLASAMLRAVGVPSRLVAADSNNIWGEAYIQGKGWVPFDVSMPYYSIAECVDSRVRFPMNITEPRLGVVYVSASGDDLKTVFWKTGETSCSLKGAEKAEPPSAEVIKKSDFILVHPSEYERIPMESKIPVSHTVAMIVRIDGPHYNLKFYDRSNGKFMHRTAIKEYNKTMVAGVENRVRMIFIPSEMGDRFIMLRMLRWDVYDGPGKKPGDKKKPEKEGKKDD